MNGLAAALANRYRIERELGAGGMAIVYLAEDLRHQRQVALKVLRADVATSVGTERFLREIRTAARLTHPHILPLFDSGEAGGLVYYVMPLVSGESLRERLRREQHLAVDEAVRIATQVAAGLDHAHRHGVIHRDVKPENILLQEGQALLADFGVARATATTADRITETGLAIGTAAYMSPEQALGEKDVDVRTDIYALGSVLYEMLVGEPPFTGVSLRAVLTKRLVDPVPSARRLRESIPRNVDHAITTALARSPADRFATVSAFADALDPRGRSSAPPRSIAVLPFLNMSPDPDNEYFSDGITEDVITHLSKNDSLKVISRTSVMHFKGTTKGLREIADMLGVATVLQGTVRRAGDRLRVTAQLIDAESDGHLWAETYDRQLADVFEVQADVATAIAAALHARLPLGDRHGTNRRPSTDVETYNLCLLGRHYWHRWTEPDFRRSIEFYERALDRDPECAAAHAGLGITLGTLALGYWSVRGTDFYPPAKRSLDRALELDPALVEAHAWLANFEAQHEYAWSAAEARVSRALALNSNSARAHDAHHLLMLAQGRFDEAAREVARAVELDPLSYFFTAQAALCAYRSRQYDTAIELFQKEIALDPNLPMGYALLTLPLIQAERCEEAVSAMSRALQLGYRIAEPFMAMALASIGRREDALATLQQIEARRATEHAWPFPLAMAYSAIGDIDSAFANLRAAFEERDFWMTWLAVEPALDPLRGDQRYDELLAEINLAAIRR